jgi:hypothetical protein
LGARNGQENQNTQQTRDGEGTVNGAGTDQCSTDKKIGSVAKGGPGELASLTGALPACFSQRQTLGRGLLPALSLRRTHFVAGSNVRNITAEMFVLSI